MSCKDTPKRRRPRGGGSVYQLHRPSCERPARGCTCFWWVHYRGPDGRRIKESSESHKKGDAERLLRQRVGARENNLPVIKNAERLTFNEAATNVINDFKNRGLKSGDEVERRIRLHLQPVFGGRRLVGISADDIRRFITQRKAATIIVRKQGLDADGVVTPEIRKPVSNGEINRELQILKRIFNLARKDGKLAIVPNIAMLREDNARQGFLDRDQVDSICQQLTPEIADVVRFAFITGWRIASEVTPLEWRNVDFNSGEVRLNAGTTKNGDGRVFPMTGELRALLKERHAAHDALKMAGQLEPWVFWRMVAKKRGGPKSPKRITTFGKQWKAACLAAGLPGRIPHDLRRSAVRTFVRGGISENTSMKLSGHKTSSVFRRYDIVSPEDLREAARKLDQQTVTRSAARAAAQQS